MAQLPHDCGKTAALKLRNESTASQPHGSSGTAPLARISTMFAGNSTLEDAASAVLTDRLQQALSAASGLHPKP